MQNYIEITQIIQVQNLKDANGYLANNVLIANIVKLFKKNIPVFLFNEQLNFVDYDLIYNFLFQNEGYEYIEDYLIKFNRPIVLNNIILQNSLFLEKILNSQLTLKNVTLLQPIYTNSILYLSISDCSTSELQNLQFPNLISFYAIDSNFDTFPTYPLLQKVIIINCPIASHQFDIINKNLKIVKLINCNLTQCQFLQQLDLEYLDLSQNYIFSFSFMKNMQNLRYFSLSGNGTNNSVLEYEHPYRYMVSIPWTRNDEIIESEQNLDINNFPILEKLQTLNLENSRLLEFLPNQTFTYLEQLNLQNNLLRKVSFSNVVEVKLNSNQLISATFNDCQYIEISESTDVQIQVINCYQLKIYQSQSIKLQGDIDKLILCQCTVQGGLIQVNEYQQLNGELYKNYNFMEKDCLNGCIFNKVIFINKVTSIGLIFPSIKYIKFYQCIGIDCIEHTFPITVSEAYQDDFCFYNNNQDEKRNQIQFLLQNRFLTLNLDHNNIFNKYILDSYRDNELVSILSVLRFIF